MQRQGLESTYLSICNKLNKVLKLWHADNPMLLYRCGYSQLNLNQMRIKFMFDEIEIEMKKEKELFENVECWVEFPCRLHDGDMILLDVLSKKYKKYVGVLDNPIVSCHSFNMDKNGIYQAVWLSF